MKDSYKYGQPYLTKLINKNIKLSTGFTQGSDDAKYQLYAVADPNCVACHLFYENAKSAVEDGSVQIHWILVDFLKASSKGRAAAIMTADDPAKAMDENVWK